MNGSSAPVFGAQPLAPPLASGKEGVFEEGENPRCEDRQSGTTDNFYAWRGHSYLATVTLSASNSSRHERRSTNSVNALVATELELI